MQANLIEPGDNPDLTAERQKATFPVDRMAAFLHGGAEIVRRRHEIVDFVQSHPELADRVPPEFLERDERYDEQARKAVAMTQIATEGIDGSDFFGEGMLYQSLVMGRDLHALSLHYLMFIPTLQGQADEEQQDEWLQLAIGRGCIGTYAQTELGHGTNLSRLETTATYETESGEFVLNSPTVTSTKWWPGSLGKSANFAIVMAQLWTNGKCHGIHPFVVQIRHLDTHEPLKSIEVGDIGPKMGINGGDNGFLRFNNHRIPRRNMLMRHAKVLPNGDYIPPRHQKLSYASMVFVRSIMCRDQAMQLGAAVTIATRYSAIRYQGGGGEMMGIGAQSEPEVRILDYQTQQYRLLPNLAVAVCFLFATMELRDLYLKVSEQLLGGNTQMLAGLHAYSSGMKAVISWEVAKGIEQCRLACGGHGYSQASGLPEIYAYAVGGCTYEGENIVLLLQVARQLLKCVDLVKAGRAGELSPMDQYLEWREERRNNNGIFGDLLDGPLLVGHFERAAREQAFLAHKMVEDGVRQRGLSWEKARNSASVELCRASKLHVLASLVRSFFSRVSQCQDTAIRPVLTDLAKLFALNKISSSASFARFMSVDELDHVRKCIYQLLDRLRPNAVALVDSLDFSDLELRSVLGRRDGNVYSALLRWAKESPMNRQQVSTTFNRHLGPMMHDGRAKL